MGKIASLITVPLITRSLTPADYGLVDLATALVALAATMGGFSADLPAARLGSMARDAQHRVIGAYFALSTAAGIGLGALIVIFSSAISSRVWQRADADLIAILAGIAVPLTTAQWSSWNVHRINQRASAYAALSTADLLLKAVVTAAAALLSSSPVVVVLVYTMATAVGAGVGVWSVRSWLGRPDFSHTTSFLSVGVPFTVFTICSVVSTYAVRSIVATESLPAVGELALALRIASVIALPLAAFQLAWAPVALSGESPARGMAGSENGSLAVARIGGAGAIALAAFGPEVVAVMGGADYPGAQEAIPGLSTAVVMSSLLFMAGVAAAASDRSLRSLSIASIVGAAAYVIFALVLLTPLGPNTAVGTAAAVSGAGALLTHRAISSTASSWVTTAAPVLLTAATLLMNLLVAADNVVLRWLVGGLALIAAGAWFVRWFRTDAGSRVAAA